MERRLLWCGGTGSQALIPAIQSDPAQSHGAPAPCSARKRFAARKLSPMGDCGRGRSFGVAIRATQSSTGLIGAWPSASWTWTAGGGAFQAAAARTGVATRCPCPMLWRTSCALWCQRARATVTGCWARSRATACAASACQPALNADPPSACNRDPCGCWLVPVVHRGTRASRSAHTMLT